MESAERFQRGEPQPRADPLRNDDLGKGRGSDIWEKCNGLRINQECAALKAALEQLASLQSNIRASVAHRSLLGYLRSLGISITRHEDQGTPRERARVSRLRSCSRPVAAVLKRYTPWRAALKKRRRAEKAATAEQVHATVPAAVSAVIGMSPGAEAAVVQAASRRKISDSNHAGSHELLEAEVVGSLPND